VHENVPEPTMRGSSSSSAAVVGSTFVSLLSASATIPSCRSIADRSRSSASGPQRRRRSRSDRFGEHPSNK
jgi:hypothetical protein